MVVATCRHQSGSSKQKFKHAWTGAALCGSMEAGHIAERTIDFVNMLPNGMRRKKVEGRPLHGHDVPSRDAGAVYGRVVVPVHAQKARSDIFTMADSAGSF